MYATLFLLVAAQPASFELKIESNTVVSVYIGSLELKPGQVYRTTTTELTVEVRYIDGEIVRRRFQVLRLSPGYHMTFTIHIEAHPPIVVEV